ncbi:MAG: hypothetical protein ACRDYZ_10575, partial [Acidimicrobiales bacterium]
MMDTVEPVEGPSRFGRPTAQAGAQVVPRPALFERLGSSARVTVVAAPAGSGKTVLLRSWIAEAGLEEHVAWVQAGRD